MTQPTSPTDSNWPLDGIELVHRGGCEGVTGSCHQLYYAPPRSLLIDCGLFQGKDSSQRENDEIEFSLDHVSALVLTHVHLDHVGRIPQLIAAGDGPIYCSPPSARFLPLVMEDTVRVGLTRNRRLITRFVDDLKRRLWPIAYHRWFEVDRGLRMRLSPAGHILGSAIVEFQCQDQCVVFSGDLGTRDQPLLTARPALHRLTC